MEIPHFITWNGFRSFVDQSYSYYSRQRFPIYWRGQQNPDWPVASQFERILTRKIEEARKWSSRYFLSDEDYRELRDGYLERFKRAASGLRGSNPKELATEEWWALGRHYGLVTPLLDWTEKPHIAAFFALSEYQEQLRTEGSDRKPKKEVAIYRLIHSDKLEGDGLRVVKPVVDELGRLQGQRGVFTWLDSEEYFELQGFMENTDRGELLTKIIISDGALQEGIKDLDAHGIDYRLLFPDLVGAALDANAKGFSYL